MATLWLQHVQFSTKYLLLRYEITAVLWKTFAVRFDTLRAGRSDRRRRRRDSYRRRRRRGRRGRRGHHSRWYTGRSARRIRVALRRNAVTRNVAVDVARLDEVRPEGRRCHIFPSTKIHDFRKLKSVALESYQFATRQTNTVRQILLFEIAHAILRTGKTNTL